MDVGVKRMVVAVGDGVGVALGQEWRDGRGEEDCGERCGGLQNARQTVQGYGSNTRCAERESGYDPPTSTLGKSRSSN